MKEYELKSQGLRLNHQAVMVEPLLAFNNFVRPGLTKADWAEDSKKQTDTNMSMREWAGLVLHSISLMSLTKDKLLIGKDFIDGDGVLIRVVPSPDGDIYEGVYVEQTLVTHRAHTNLYEGINERIRAKSAHGGSYAENLHLILWLNINGDINTGAMAELVKAGRFNIVNIIGYHEDRRRFLSFIFDKDEGMIHRFQVAESDLLL